MITGVVLDICNMSVTQMCMVEGEDNPELIEKILVMHGKQQQKQQEDLDDAADAEGWIDVCKETDAQHRKIMEKLQENEKIENTIQNYFWSGSGRIEVKKYLTQLSCSRYHKYGYKIKCTEFMGICA